MRCGSILEGETFNNVTGKYGYRDSRGYFHPYSEDRQVDFFDYFGLPKEIK